MRIVIDLQGAQGVASRGRGIGRYSLALAQAMVRNRGKHEVLIALNGMFPDSIAPIRAAFEGLLPQNNIRVWQAASPVRAGDDANRWRRAAAKAMREVFLYSLEPDVVHISSLFEGYGDDAVHSIGAIAAHVPVAVTVYDLIPLLQSDIYLTPYPLYETFYREQLEHLKNADLCLGISESACQEVVQHLGMPAQRVVNVAAAADPQFQPVELTAQQKANFLSRFGLRGSFVLYSGASDERKNHLRLIKAYAMLPRSIRSQHQLAIIGHLSPEHRVKFEQYAKQCGLGPSEMIIAGRVNDQELVWFYNLCELFVFPSWHEGFGLPALEAMSCGAPVVGPLFLRWAGHPEEKMSQEVRALRNQLYRLDAQSKLRIAALELDVDAILYIKHKQAHVMPGQTDYPCLPSSIDPDMQIPLAVGDLLLRLRDASLRSTSRSKSVKIGYSNDII